MDGITTRNPIMDVPELIPMEDYDPFRVAQSKRCKVLMPWIRTIRNHIWYCAENCEGNAEKFKARLQASIRWLLTKAFGNNIPRDLCDPFFEDDQGVTQFKMVLINGLVSGDFYCQTCAAIFPQDTHTRWDGHWSVMQALSRKGVYVVDTNDSAVTETLLLQTQPFKVNAHLAMIESLMQAFASETITIDRVSQAVRKFTSFNASSELPNDVEDSITFWMNKVCGTVRNRAQRELLQDGSEEIDIPVIEDLLKDVSDGSCLATVISFYCPEILPLTEVAAKSNIGIADSLYNVQLVCDFCDKHIPGALILSINDLFYTHPQLRLCLIAFLTELFYKFEVHRLPIVRDTTKPYTILTGDPSSPTTSKRLIDRSVISNATKRSFQNSLGPGDLRTTASSSNPDLHNNCLPPPRRPLLPRRLGHRNNPNSTDENTPPRRVVKDLGFLRRSRSLPSIEERDGVRESMRAWEDQNNPSNADAMVDNARIDSARSGSTLLGNVSIDSDMSLDLTTDSSVELSEFDDTPRNQQPRGHSAPIGPITTRMRDSAQGHIGKPRPHTAGHSLRTNPDEIKVEHFTRATSARNPSPGRHSNPHGNPHGDSRNPSNGKEQPLEPLLPAKLKPAKEKTANHNKEVESGEKPEKKSPSSPNKPRALSLKSTSGGADEDSSSDEEFQTPSAENVPFFDKSVVPPGAEESADSKPAAGEPAHSAGAAPRGRQYEAFYVDTDNPPISAVTSNGVPVASGGSRTFDRHKPHAQSFTLHDNVHTPESAIAAGIPVVDESLPKPTPRRPTSRESANASKGFRGSSRDKMDQELSKLNADTRNKEIKDTPKDSFFLIPSGSSDVQRPDTLNVPKPIQVDGPGSASVNGDRPSPKTSFAEIKKQKDSGDVSPVTYLQHGSPLKNLGDKSSLKSAFHKVNPGSNPHGKQKKTSFAALPNQTTWQESAQKSSFPDGVDSNKSSEDADSVQPMATELVSIRMRLEERRRQIESEKRRMEMQWNKQRQRVGKQAFIAVISKGKPGDGSSPEETAAGPSRKTPEGPSGLKGVTDSGLGGSQTEGEPDSVKLPDQSQAQEEARRRSDEERREKIRVEREEKEKREQEERDRKKREQEEQERKELEELQRKEREREEAKRRERERKEQEELERQNAIEAEKLREQKKKEEEMERLREIERLREKDREEEKDRIKKEIEEKEKERHREIEKEIELELERERRRQRDIERELERELERERQKTRQAERDLELERLREKHSLLEKRLEEQLRARSESPGSGSDSSQSKRFSREGIQNLLDTGKQRWMSREGTPESRGGRPKSYAGGEVDAAEPVVTTGPLSTSAYASSPPVSAMSTLARDKGEYGQGLDKLNTSLTDLQGEIMRLSLEQDHIKNMVTEPRSNQQQQQQQQQQPPPKRAPSSERQSGQSRYYGMYPEPSGEPDIAGGMRAAGSTASSAVYSQAASVPGHPPAIYGASQSSQYPPTHPMYQHPPYMPPTNQFGQYMPYQQHYPQPAPPPQYPQHPQGATTPLYHPPPGAPLYQAGYGPPPPGHQGQWPGHMQHPYGPVVTSNPPGQPYSQSVDYHGPASQTQTTSAHHSQQMSPSSTNLPPGMTTSGGSGGHPDLDEPHGDTASSGTLPSSTHSHHSLPGGDEAALLSPYHEDHASSATSPNKNRASPNSPNSPAATSSPTSNRPSNQDGTTAASPSAQSPGTAYIPENDPKGENEGFFIAFDNDSPRRQKPKLGGNRTKKKPVPVVEPPITKSEAPSGLQSAPPPSSSPPRFEKTPGIGFTIGDDDEEEQQQKSDVFLPRQQPDLSEMERKKQRILELQMKRKVELEKKRLKMEDARAKKEEQKRLKQEEMETKKAEEKARREAIYAQYLQRKADAENMDEDIKSAPVVKKRERQKPRAPRPKSQPPVPLSSGGGGHGVLADDRNSASSHSHSSQEDLYPRGTFGGGGGGTDQVDVGYNLAYGGLTHRRPPSPVWHKPNRPGLLMRRVFPGNRMHAESLPASLDQSGQSPGHGDNASEAGGSATVEYHGPKLFVKPSSKSNRHIIMNAISHCCLAGTVNNDIKNKVTEEVQRSDGKHFIILFRDGGQQYRSVYTFNPETEEVAKLLGTGPKQIHNKMMERFYKYNSGSKSFSEVTSTKHLSVSIDAVTISNHYWQKKPPARKAGPNMY